eukprot:m.287974 g.287974  ORF g.287974 m.287974 type:complete len:95 (-) comp15795_c3_seq10:1353-1637(-)
MHHSLAQSIGIVLTKHSTAPKAKACVQNNTTVKGREAAGYGEVGHGCACQKSTEVCVRVCCSHHLYQKHTLCLHCSVVTTPRHPVAPLNVSCKG